MQSLIFLTYVFQKLSMKNLCGGSPLVKEGLMTHAVHLNTGCLKKIAIFRGTVLVVWLFNFVFSGCLTRRTINAARIVVFKSTIKLNNLSSDKKHNFIICRLIFNYQ